MKVAAVVLYDVAALFVALVTGLFAGSALANGDRAVAASPCPRKSRAFVRLWIAFNELLSTCFLISVPASWFSWLAVLALDSVPIAFLIVAGLVVRYRRY